MVTQNMAHEQHYDAIRKTSLSGLDIVFQICWKVIQLELVGVLHAAEIKVRIFVRERHVIGLNQKT